MTTKQQLKPKAGPLRRAWQTWKAIAHKIGDFQARVILTILYFLPLAPFALAVKWSTDPMAIKPGTLKGWRPAPDIGPPVEAAARQF
jgi:hypothetical protein